MKTEKPNYKYCYLDIYGILDNHREPFIVLLYESAGKAIVFKNDLNNLTNIMEIDFENVFIGKDYMNEENYDGNSILFEIKEQE